MKTYLVGGAVRDRLLGLPVREKDYVVVGATPEQLLAQGYRQVGKDFPVFLHPTTHHEYALARTERKTAPGYRGFIVHADPQVTLEEDLRRRDLTINALAEDEQGRLIDLHNGREDLERRLLRHISAAFTEDPVRILRVARFAARYAHLDFRVADETRRLMSEMVEAGEVDALVPERVWQELAKALAESRPSRFFQVLEECGALKRLFPELARLFGVPQPKQWHPEIDTGIHTMMVVDTAARLTPSPEIRFAALTHDLGKGVTPSEQWPRHPGHERHSVELIDSLCNRLKAPVRFRELAKLVARYHSDVHRAEQLKASTILRLLENTDALRRPERFQQLLLACEADFRGRSGFEERHYPQRLLLSHALSAVRGLAPGDVIAGERDPDKIQQRLRDARISAIKAVSGASQQQ